MSERPAKPVSLISRLKILATNRRQMALVVVGLASFAVFMTLSAVFGSADLAGFEAGKVADRDVVADSDVVYIDRNATRIRREAEGRLVHAVFSIDAGVTESVMATFRAFADGYRALAASGIEASSLGLRLQGQFPGRIPVELLASLVRLPDAAPVLEHCEDVLASVFAQGISAFPETGLEQFNPAAFEIRRESDGPLVYEQVLYEKALTRKTAEGAVTLAVGRLGLDTAATRVAIGLVMAFVRENSFFDEDQSRRRLETALTKLEPVLVTIPEGEKVIRKGFIVTETDIERLAALRQPAARVNPAFILGSLGVMVLLVLGASAILSGDVSGVRLRDDDFVFVLAAAALYFVVASTVFVLVPVSMGGHVESLLPTALLTMLVAIMFGESFSLLYTVVLASSLFVAARLDAFVVSQALVSGIAGILLVRRAEKRIDLVRAGGQLAVIRFIAGTALALMSSSGTGASLVTGFWSGVNGFMSGVLVLALLPVFEQTLNASTVFRLQELSDLNAPVLKQLLSVAPGTYSHSVAVAHLAESACREIGANPLLARVGAYYHDIGKMEKPEYFIENQSGYNKHDEINPRLSATVLKGHVKAGMARAEMLKLPQGVQEIIATHHGTSLIKYFFAQAPKGEFDQASPEFRYPGPLPVSVEAAVVMLADGVEAGSRTLKKPTLAKLEQFVRDTVMERYTSGQLSETRLTIRDIQAIIKSFVRILSGHYHARIEYPKITEQE